MMLCPTLGPRGPWSGGGAQYTVTKMAAALSKLSLRTSNYSQLSAQAYKLQALRNRCVSQIFR